MPRKRRTKAQELSRAQRRRRKFIRKDTQQEYKLRSGMVLVQDDDGTQTYFRPQDLAISRPKDASPQKSKCTYCDNKTIRSGMTIDGQTVPMCVECGTRHNYKPKEAVIRFGERRS